MAFDMAIVHLYSAQKISIALYATEVIMTNGWICYSPLLIKPTNMEFYISQDLNNELVWYLNSKSMSVNSFSGISRYSNSEIDLKNINFNSGLHYYWVKYATGIRQ